MDPHTSIEAYHPQIYPLSNISAVYITPNTFRPPFSGCPYDVFRISPPTTPPNKPHTTQIFLGLHNTNGRTGHPGKGVPTIAIVPLPTIAPQYIHTALNITRFT